MWLSFVQDNGDPLLLNDESGVVVYPHPKAENLSRIMLQSGSCRDVRIDFGNLALMLNAVAVPECASELPET